MKIDPRPLELIRKLRAYLRSEINEAEINLWVLERMDATEQPIEADEYTDLINDTFWAIRLLLEPKQFKTKREEIEYLLLCLEGNAQYDKIYRDDVYRK